MFGEEKRHLGIGQAAPNDIHLRASYSSQAGSDNYTSVDVNPKRKIISTIPWRCPPKVALNPDWRVAAGEESQEAVRQQQRESMVLEAVYSHPSVIPPSPSALSDVEDCVPDDSLIPLIPLNDVEEQEALISSQTSGGKTIGVNHAVVEGDVAAAAGAAYTAIMKLKERGNMIDPGLLITLLSNPEMLREKLEEEGLLGEPSSAQNQRSAAPIRSSNGASAFIPPSPKQVPISALLKSGQGTLHLIEPSPVSSQAKSSAHLPSDSASVSVLPAPRHLPISAPHNTGQGTAHVPSPIGLVIRSPDYELGPSGMAGYAPLSLPKVATNDTYAWTPSIPFSGSAASQTLIQRLLSESGRTSSNPNTHTGGLQAVAHSVIPPASKPFGFQVTGPSFSRSLSAPVGVQPARQSVSMAASRSVAFQEVGQPFPCPILRPSGLQPVNPSVSAPGMLISNGLREYAHTSTDESMRGPNLNKGVVRVSAEKSIIHELPNLDIEPLSPHFCPPALGMRPLSPGLPRTCAPRKDVDYLRNLVKLHGEDQENPKVSDTVSSELIMKQQKPCKYFNTSTGCIRGSSCTYQHSLSNSSSSKFGVDETPSAKRLKVGLEMSRQK